jgi:hypothetical protein
VELVGAIQKEIGGLIEAVNSLKEQSREHGKELRDLSKDFHAVKVTGKTLLWLIGIVGTILGIFLAAYARQLFGGR